MSGLRKKLEDLMVAISFSEAGDERTAREVLKRKKARVRKVERVPATQQQREERLELKAPERQ